MEFLPIRFLDIIDILVVGFLIFQIYRLLKGSIAFNIFIGLVSLFVVWWLVRILKMDLLSLILDQFVRIGVLIIVIIFQPEIRRFLLLLGENTLKQRSIILSNFFVNNLKQNSITSNDLLEIK